MSGETPSNHGLIESHLSYAHAIAAEIVKTLPFHVERGDLRAAAELGLTEAAHYFDHRPGVQFKTFAYYRIRGDSCPDAVDPSLSAEDRIIQEEWSTRLHQALPRLSAQDRQIIYAYYFEGRNLEEIGDSVGLSKSWVCRLHGKAIVSLRGLLA
jgi:RNA polymerase sigma factor (sigma-70 family)